MDISGIHSLFNERFGGPCRTFRAPGRINLIGEHTDYNLGLVMPAAIDRYIYLSIRPNSKSLYRIWSADYDALSSFDASVDAGSLPFWAKFPLGVIRELQVLGCDIPGFDAVFGGDIPQGAGLSSSAAIEMAVATALNALFGLNLDGRSLCRAGQLAEHNTVGVKCGIMDQFASFFGKKNSLILLDCRDLSFELKPLHGGAYRLLLADTGVKHSLASSAYNERREQCEEGVRVLRSYHKDIESLRDASLYMLESVRHELNPVIIKRCEYVIEENLRVIQISDALSAGDIRQAGRLLFETHGGLQHKYEVSCPELDLLVDVARGCPGVAGARMMGGGFGGCTINLIHANALDDFKQKATKTFQKTFGKAPVFHEVALSDGAAEVTHQVRPEN